MSEEVGQDLIFDVLSFHTISGATLFHHFQNDLLHLFVRRLELSDKDQHHFSSIVVRVLGVHEWDKIANGLEEGSQTLAAMGANTFPQGFQNAIETLDTWKSMRTVSVFKLNMNLCPVPFRIDCLH